MGIFNRKAKAKATPQHVDQLHKEPGTKAQADIHKDAPKAIRKLARIPILGELLALGPLIPKLVELFRDNRGKMSSKRFGAGALVAAGIALVSAGAEQDSGPHFWGGFGLCAMGVILFGLTRMEFPES